MSFIEFNSLIAIQNFSMYLFFGIGGKRVRLMESDYRHGHQ